MTHNRRVPCEDFLFRVCRHGPHCAYNHDVEMLRDIFPDAPLFRPHPSANTAATATATATALQRPANPRQVRDHPHHHRQDDDFRVSSMLHTMADGPMGDATSSNDNRYSSNNRDTQAGYADRGSGAPAQARPSAFGTQRHGSLNSSDYSGGSSNNNSFSGIAMRQGSSGTSSPYLGGQRDNHRQRHEESFKQRPSAHRVRNPFFGDDGDDDEALSAVRAARVRRFEGHGEGRGEEVHVAAATSHRPSLLQTRNPPPAYGSGRARVGGPFQDPFRPVASSANTPTPHQHDAAGPHSHSHHQPPRRNPLGGRPWAGHTGRPFNTNNNDRNRAFFQNGNTRADFMHRLLHEQLFAHHHRGGHRNAGHGLHGDIDPDTMSYEELLALGDQIGHVECGLAAHVLDRLPRPVHRPHSSSNHGDVKGNPVVVDVDKDDDDDDDGGDDACIICSEELVAGESVLLQFMPCKHTCCVDCGERWLKTKRNCPICKTEVRF